MNPRQKISSNQSCGRRRGRADPGVQSTVSTFWDNAAVGVEGSI
jgi:hypothetical protein